MALIGKALEAILTMNLPAQAPTQLQSADPADWKVAPGWQPLVDAFFADARGQALRAFLQSRLQADRKSVV